MSSRRLHAFKRLGLADPDGRMGARVAGGSRDTFAVQPRVAEEKRQGRQGAEDAESERFFELGALAVNPVPARGTSDGRFVQWRRAPSHIQRPRSVALGD